MKKFFAISFLFIYLFSTTELSQLLKIPLLVEHFIEHKEKNGHLTLGQFLYMHYAGDVHDATDMKLPFKTPDNCGVFVLNYFLPSQRIIVEKPLQFLEKKYLKPTEQFLHSSYLSYIWQPPRFS